MKLFLLPFFLGGFSCAVFAQNVQDSSATPKPENLKAKVTYPIRPEIVYEVPEESILGQSMRKGRVIYLNDCLRCHGDKGQGIEGLFPPLSKSDYLMADAARSIKVTLYGLEGKTKVNGKEYNQKMEGHAYLKDQEVADLHNYILNSWGNHAKMIGVNQVKLVRAESKITNEKPQFTKNK